MGRKSTLELRPRCDVRRSQSRDRVGIQCEHVTDQRTRGLRHVSDIPCPRDPINGAAKPRLKDKLQGFSAELVAGTTTL